MTDPARASSKCNNGTSTLNLLVRRAEQGFRSRYGRPSRWIAAAPGRVNLIGEHTDYNGGFVLPMAIDAYTVIAADHITKDKATGDGTTLRLYSAAMGESVTLSLPQAVPPAASHWANYVLGVVAGCQALGMCLGSVDAWIESGVPVGGGLSSSAALEVATATLAEAITGQTFDRMEKVLLCQKAEHDYAHMPCGIMDQFTSVSALPDHLILLDCRAEHGEMVPLVDPGVTVLIIDSGVKHELARSEYAVRRRQCEDAARALGVDSLRDVTAADLDRAADRLDPQLMRRARHVVNENTRTVRAAKAVAAADWSQVGALMVASHASLRDDYEVSCTELNLLVDLATELGDAGGVIGARMTGGGFGGCIVSLVRTKSIGAATAAILDGYRKVTGIDALAFTTRPARGAHVVLGDA